MAIALVQAKRNNGASSSPSITFASTGAGNLLVVFIASGQNTSSPTYAGPTGWSSEAEFSQNVFNNRNAQVFYYVNNPGGITTATFTATPAPDGWTIEAFEFSGVATSSAVDQEAQGNNGNGAGVISFSRSITTTVDGDLVLGWGSLDVPSTGSTTITGPSTGGWTNEPSVQDSGGFESSIASYVVQATHGAITYTVTAASANNWMAAIIAFKPAAGAAPAGWLPALWPPPAQALGKVPAAPTPITAPQRSGRAAGFPLATPTGYLFPVASPPITTLTWTPPADSQTNTDSASWTATYAPTADAQTNADGQSTAAVWAAGTDSQANADSSSTAATYVTTDSQTLGEAVQEAGVWLPVDSTSNADAVADTAVWSPTKDSQTNTDGWTAVLAGQIVWTPPADSQTNTDSWSATPVWGPVDSLTSADSLAITAVYTPAPADAQTLAEAVQEAGVWLPVDSTSHADALAETAVWAPAADSQTLADAQAGALAWVPVPADSLTTIDSQTGTPAWAVVDSQQQADAHATVMVWRPAPADTLANADSATYVPSLPSFNWNPPADTQTLTDSATYGSVPYVIVIGRVRDGLTTTRVRDGRAPTRVRDGLAPARAR